MFEDGSGDSRLIAPLPAWTDWDARAESSHKIRREQLVAEGQAPQAVAAHLMKVFAGHKLYASAPSWDGKWLSVLLRGGGFPRHALRLADTEEACVEAAFAVLGPQHDGAVLEIVHEAREAARLTPVAHRAQADAEHERLIWLDVTRRAEAVAAGL
ncbi:MAG: transcriptional regulator [Caulobacter sp.]|nr:transcriptional regulator [Caulobacter sp.]